MSPAPPIASHHRFAWDGLSIEVPTDWNLAHYRFGHHASQARLEDDESLRLQLDWTRTRRPIARHTLADRAARQARAILAASLHHHPVTDMPPGWSASHHLLPGERQLSIASWLSPDAHTLVMLQVLSERETEHASLRRLRAIASSFTFYDGPTIPWHVYDVAFDLPRHWWLTDTSFAAGSKRFLFQHRLRRLLLWQSSVASIALRGRTPAQFAVDLLHAHRPLRHHRFVALDPHRFALAPQRRWPVLPADNLARACLRYTGACVLLPNQDSLFLSLFNYRSAADIAAIRPHLSPERFPWIRPQAL